MSNFISVVVHYMTIILSYYHYDNQEESGKSTNPNIDSSNNYVNHFEFLTFADIYELKYRQSQTHLYITFVSQCDTDIIHLSFSVNFLIQVFEHRVHFKSMT